MIEKFAKGQAEVLEKKAEWIAKVKEVIVARREEDARLVEEYNNIGAEAPGFSQSDPVL